MEKNNLSKNDYECMNEILLLTDKIYCIYIKLWLLEVNKKKNSEDYKSLLEKLSRLLKKENELYNNFLNSADKLIELLETYFDDNEHDMVDILNFIREDINLKIIKARIAVKLDKMANHAEFPDDEEEQFNDFENYTIPEIDNTLDDDIFDNINPQKVEESYFYAVNLEDAIELDLLNTILNMSNRYIKNSNYIEYVNYLLKFKYMLSFVFQPIENDLISHNFDINSNLYLISKIIVDRYNGNDKDIIDIQNELAQEMLYEQSENLTYLLFKDLKEKNNYRSALISEIIIRSSLIFSSKEITTNFKKFILGEIDDFKTSNPEMEIIINRALGNLNKDKQIPLKISLKL